MFNCLSVSSWKFVIVGIVTMGFTTIGVFTLNVSDSLFILYLNFSSFYASHNMLKKYHNFDAFH